MARAPRIEFAGAIYHVMNRGDHYEKIFRDDKDRAIFLETLWATCQSSGWKVHSFVFMANHYHLLIETQRPTLVKGMQYLNGTYTQRFNARHKLRGHLFQGRYKALLVDVESKGYFLTVSDYIHLNPLRAKRVQSTKELLKDPWNSVGWLAGVRKKKPDWLSWEYVYGELGLKGWGRRSRREYRNYVERRYEEEVKDFESYRGIRRGWCFGSESFAEKMKEKLEDLKEEKVRGPECWSGEAMEEAEEERASRFLLKGLRKLGYKHLEEVQGLARYLLGWYVRENSKVRVQWLAEQLNVKTRGGMSHMLYWIRKRIDENRDLKNRWKSLL
jgi:putative transposase